MTKEVNILRLCSLDYGVPCTISKDIQTNAILWAGDHFGVLSKRMCGKTEGRMIVSWKLTVYNVSSKCP